MTSVIPYYAAYIVPLSIILIVHLDLRGVWYGITFIIIFGCLPIIELITPIQQSNPSETEAKALEHKFVFRIPLILYVPFQLYLIWMSSSVVYSRSLTNFEFIAFALSIGTCTGAVGFNVAHELMHKNNWFERTLGKCLLVCGCYGHFFVEHIWGHHKQVATDNDPATAKVGDVFPIFFVKSVVGGFKSAWNLEKKRLSNSNYFVYGLRNQVILLDSISVIIALSIYWVYGIHSCIFFLLQSFVAIVILENVNYIEHYGLTRNKIGQNNYERVNVLHSWNADKIVTNYMSFKLQRHSDHHANALRSYQVLRTYEISPQMPTG